MIGQQRSRAIEQQGKPKQIQVGGPPRSQIGVGMPQPNRQPPREHPGYGSANNGPITNDEEPDEDFEKLRQMLMDTQNEIDAIL